MIGCLPLFSLSPSPHDFVLHIDILPRLDLHHLEQSFRSYRMKRSARDPHRLPLGDGEFVAIEPHPAATLDHRPRLIAPFVQVIGERISRTERNLDRETLRLRIDDAELAP